MAILTHSSLNYSFLTTEFTIPFYKASYAGIGSDVNIYFIALVFPTNYVNLCVPPNPGIKPNFNSGSPSLQSSVATKISPLKANSNPPPKAAPFTPIISGFLIYSKTVNMFKNMSPFNYVSKEIFEISLILAPAQNTLSSLDNKINT